MSEINGLPQPDGEATGGEEIAKSRIETIIQVYLQEKWPEHEKLFDRTTDVCVRVMQLLESIIPGDDEETASLRSTILEKMLNQQITNPEHYVSHGADHGMTTSELATNAFDAIPALSDSLRKIFGDNARIVLSLVALIHDIGYPLLKTTDKKIVHALHGAKIFEKNIAPLMKAKFGLNQKQIDIIYDVMAKHDDDGIENRDSLVVASLEENPLLFAVRLSDRLDMASSRLSEIQRNPAFCAVLKELFIAGQPGGLLYEASPDTYKSKLQALKKELLERFEHMSPEKDRPRLREIVEYCDDNSFPHFVGCIAVKEVSFSTNQTGNIEVTVIKHDDFLNLGLTINGVDVTDYQLWRANNALKSLTAAGVSPHVSIGG